MRKWLIGLALIALGAAAGAGALWLNVRQRLAADAATEHEPPKATEEATSTGHAADGETGIHLDAQTQTRVGLQIEPLVAVSHQLEITAYGVLQEDPQRSFTLRAPIAGVVLASADVHWPDIGQHLNAGDLLGHLEPRLTPAERVDLATRLTQARADVAAAEAALSTARSSYDNKKKLNAENRAVSDRALEEAESKVKSEEARLNAAADIVRLIEAAQSAANGMTKPLELRAARDGEVVESPVQPGEAVEAGQVLIRSAAFDVLIARVEVPVGTRFDESVTEARIVPVGADDVTLHGTCIGFGSGAATTDRGAVLLLRVPTAGQKLRPGAPVVAYLPAGGGAQAGVLVPRSAVVRFQGRAWVYVQTADDRFARRELTQAEPTELGWFAGAGLAPGERAVIAGAQVLLSEEQKGQIEQEQAATE